MLYREIEETVGYVDFFIISNLTKLNVGMEWCN